MKQKLSLIFVAFISAWLTRDIELLLLDNYLGWASIYGYAIVLLVIAPVFEESIKYWGIGFSLLESNIDDMNDRNLALDTLVFAYAFQVAEAFLNGAGGEWLWYFRLILPIHVTFSLLATSKYKYSLTGAILLHAIYNTHALQGYGYLFWLFILINCIVFVLLIFERIIEKPIESK